MSHDDAIAFLKAERAAHAPLDLDQTALEHGSMMPADPTMDEFETCLRVLRWMRDTDNGLHESWTIPLTHVCGAVRACVETLNTHNMMINEAVHVMLPTFEKPFPRFFRHVARPTSDAVFIRWNSKRDCCVVTVDGTVRPPACEWNWIDQLVVVDMGHAFEITEQDAAAMLLEVAAGGNPWREP